eukprot:Mycagemm_TRINITY_DN5441_c0_g1::TRINITY_DN5441_c0_g1_i1::g.1975::m.1975 type:complete len:130 gc:universal TRINITY_DN5441_c0_g1_i1:790-1179(+)
MLPRSACRVSTLAHRSTSETLSRPWLWSLTAPSPFIGESWRRHNDRLRSLDTKSRLYGEFSREIHPDLFNLHKIACARGVPHEQSQTYFLKSKYVSDKFADSYDFMPPEPRDLLFLPPRDFLSYIYPAV